MNYWRTKDKAEVDFVIEAGKILIPVEVKYKYLKQDKVPASLRSFIAKYNPEKAYIIKNAGWLLDTELLILDELHKMEGWKN